MKIGIVGVGGMGRHHATVVNAFEFVDEVMGSCGAGPRPGTRPNGPKQRAN